MRYWSNGINSVVSVLFIFLSISCGAQEISGKYYDTISWSSSYEFTDEGNFYFNTSTGSIQSVMKGVYKISGDSIYLDYKRVPEPKHSEVSIEKVDELSGIIMYIEVREPNNDLSVSIPITYSIDSAEIISAYTDQNGELTISLNESRKNGSLDVRILGYESIQIPTSQFSKGIWNVKIRLAHKRFNYPFREPESFHFTSFPDRLLLQNRERSLELKREVKGPKN